MSTYMMQCLLHPTHGYYVNPDSNFIGSRRDLTTNPEAEQMFGEVWAGFLKATLNSSKLRVNPGNSSLLFGFWSNIKSHEGIFLSELSNLDLEREH